MSDKVPFHNSLVPNAATPFTDKEVADRVKKFEAELTKVHQAKKAARDRDAALSAKFDADYNYRVKDWDLVEVNKQYSPKWEDFGYNGPGNLGWRDTYNIDKAGFPKSPSHIATWGDGWGESPQDPSLDKVTMICGRLQELESSEVPTGRQLGYKLFTFQSGVGLMGGFSKVWDSDTFKASCYTGSSVRAHLAMGTCSCGIYSWRTLSHSAADSRNKLSFVLAHVSNYGIVNPHSAGYKSEFTRIHHIDLVGNAQIEEITRYVNLLMPNVTISNMTLDDYLDKCLEELDNARK